MLFSDAPYYFPKGIAYIFNVECENHNGCKRSLVGVEILDETRVSLSRKDERLIYIDIPRRNASESRNEILSTRSRDTKGNCTSAGKMKG